MTKRTEYVIVENAGYENEKDVNVFLSPTSANYHIEMNYHYDESVDIRKDVYENGELVFSEFV